MIEPISCKVLTISKHYQNKKMQAFVITSATKCVPYGNHRTIDWLRLEHTSGDCPVHQHFSRSTTKADWSGSCPLGSWVPPWMETPQPVWATSSVNYSFLLFKCKFTVFHFVPLVSCSNVHHWPHSGSVFTPPIRCLYTLLRSPWAFSRLNSFSSQPLDPLQGLHRICDPLLNSVQYLLYFPLYWGTQNQTWHFKTE